MSIEELGRRAVACKAWPGYLPGMRDINGARFLSDADGDFRVDICTDSIEGFWPPDNRDTYTPSAPDLNDRATLLLFRDIVARAYGGERVTIQPDCNGVIRANVYALSGDFAGLFSGAVNAPVTEVEVLVSMLEALND